MGQPSGTCPSEGTALGLLPLTVTMMTRPVGFAPSVIPREFGVKTYTPEDPLPLPHGGTQQVHFLG